MCDMYGDKWAFQYHIYELDQLNMGRAVRRKPPYELLPEIDATIE